MVGERGDPGGKKRRRISFAAHRMTSTAEGVLAGMRAMRIMPRLAGWAALK